MLLRRVSHMKQPRCESTFVIFYTMSREMQTFFDTYEAGPKRLYGRVPVPLDNRTLFPASNRDLQNG